MRGFLLHMEEFIKANGGYGPDNDVCKLEHHFNQGVYTRRIYIPRGNYIVGKIHKQEHLNTLESGSVVYMTEEGVETLVGPTAMISPAGTKRFLFTLTDVVWATYHNTDKTNPKDAEDDVIAKEYEDIGLSFTNPRICLEGGI
jgi:hypothetical protein